MDAEGHCWPDCQFLNYYTQYQTGAGDYESFGLIYQDCQQCDVNNCYECDYETGMCLTCYDNACSGKAKIPDGNTCIEVDCPENCTSCQWNHFYAGLECLDCLTD